MSLLLLPSQRSVLHMQSVATSNPAEQTIHSETKQLSTQQDFIQIQTAVLMYMNGFWCSSPIIDNLQKCENGCGKYLYGITITFMKDICPCRQMCCPLYLSVSGGRVVAVCFSIRQPSFTHNSNMLIGSLTLPATANVLTLLACMWLSACHSF